MVKEALGFVAILLFFTLSPAQNSKKSTTLETVINEYVGSYNLTEDNKFRLCAYTELKGRYSRSYQTLLVNFGALGYLSFYEKNCLLRAGNHKVYSLNRNDMNDPGADALNQQLDEMFDKIILLGNVGASQDHVNFVDRSLAKKNIEPFEKVYLRHILLKYGKYDQKNNEVTFHTDWLPTKTFEYEDPTKDVLVKKHVTPLRIKLNEEVIRGYYINSGGTVYIENVDRDVYFATGEQYDYNVSAFKLFVQKVFVQTIQYISQKETNRLDNIVVKDGEGEIVSEMVTYNSPIKDAEKHIAGKKRQQYFQKPTSNTQETPEIQPLYHGFNWIPMMLTIMRTHGVNIGDVDIIKYFIDEPYFPQLYEQLTKEEKEKVDKYKSKKSRLSVAG